jgi:hypothetical protein
MKLRDHPLMSRRGIRNWPPVWVSKRGQKDNYLKGEVGVLKAVLPSKIKPEDRCLLLISHQGSEYLGCLLFNDRTFCRHIAGVLHFCRHRSIPEIGSIDVRYFFLDSWVPMKTAKNWKSEMDDLALKYLETYDKEIIENLYKFARQLDKKEKQKAIVPVKL